MTGRIAEQIKEFKDWISGGMQWVFHDSTAVITQKAASEGFNHVMRTLESIRIELSQQASIGPKCADSIDHLKTELDDLKELFILAVDPDCKTMDEARAKLKEREKIYRITKPMQAAGLRTDTREYAINLTNSILGTIETIERDHGLDYVGGIKQDAEKLKECLEKIPEA